TLPGGITFLGGTGDGDALLVKGAGDLTWHVTGANAGSAGAVQFSGVENLLGDADNQDTFVIEAGGSVGLVDGGAGGFDTLVIEDGPYAKVVSTATGPDSGSVALDDATIQYAGLEPLLVNAGTAADQVYNLTASADEVEVRHVSGN